MGAGLILMSFDPTLDARKASLARKLLATAAMLPLIAGAEMILLQVVGIA